MISQMDEAETFLLERFPDGFMLLLKYPTRLVRVPLSELGEWTVALRVTADDLAMTLAAFDADDDDDG